MTVALDKVMEVLPDTFVAKTETGRLLIAAARDELYELKSVQTYTGRCFRHHLRFTPSEQFHNNCPACYWEGQYAFKRKEME